MATKTGLSPIPESQRIVSIPKQEEQQPKASSLEKRVFRCAVIIASIAFFFACLFYPLVCLWRWCTSPSSNDDTKTTQAAQAALSPSPLASSTQALDGSSSGSSNPVLDASPDVSSSEEGEITIKPDPKEQLYADLANDLIASAILREKGQKGKAKEKQRRAEVAAMNKFLSDRTGTDMPSRELRERFRNLSSHLIGHGVTALDAYTFVRLLADDIQRFTEDTRNPKRDAWTKLWGTRAGKVAGAVYEEFSLLIRIREAMDWFLSSRPLDAVNFIDQADDFLEQKEDFLEQIIAHSFGHSFPASDAMTAEELSEKRKQCRNFFHELAKIGIRDQNGSVIACAEDFLKEIKVRRMQEASIRTKFPDLVSDDESSDSGYDAASSASDRSSASPSSPGTEIGPNTTN